MATYSDKLERMTHVLQTRTGLNNIIPGSKIHQILESFAYEMMNLEYDIEAYNRKNSLISAEGKDLDNIGDSPFFGKPRLGVVKTYVTDSMKALKFYVKNGTFGDINYDMTGTVKLGKSIIVPEGTIIESVTANRILKFRTTDTYELLPSEKEIYISAELIQGSYDVIPQNTLIRHNFSAYTQALNNKLLVTNVTAIGTGRESESDQNYRYRLINSPKAFPKTTEAGILELILTLPDVSSARIEKAPNGGGTFDIYVQGISPVTSNDTIENVKEIVSTSVGPWMVFNVLRPDYIGLELEIVLITRNGANEDYISSVAKDIIASYINNYQAYEFSILELAKHVEVSIDDVLSAVIVKANKYYGSEVSRKAKAIDLEEINPTIQIFSNEKLIVETLTDLENPILVTIK